jgi:hypothetical protein
MWFMIIDKSDEIFRAKNVLHVTYWFSSIILSIVDAVRLAIFRLLSGVCSRPRP